MPGIPLQVNPIPITPTTGTGAITGMGGAAPTPTPPPPTDTTGSSGSGAGVGQFISQQRQQGIPDNQIYDYLHQNGMVPTNAVVQKGQQPQGPQLSDTGSFGGNALNSAGQFIGNVASAVGNVFNPDPAKNTLANIGRVAGGLTDIPAVLGQNLASGKGPDTGGASIDNKPLQSLIENLGQRYGSWENVKKTAYQDPVGFLADASLLVEGGGEALSAAGKAGDIGKVADLGGAVSKVGQAANPISLASKGVGSVANLAKVGLEKVAPFLEQSNLRLTPVQRVANDAKLADVTDYISKHIPVGSPEARFEAAGARVDQFENQIQNWLDTDAQNITIDKQTLLDGADAVKSEFKNDRDSLAINRQIEDFKATLEANNPNPEGIFNPDGTGVTSQIPVADINKLKRSTFESAFNQAGNKVSDVVEYKLGDLLKSQIENATKDTPLMDKYPIASVNEAYGIALTAKKLLKVAIGRPQMGFTERLLADAIGFGTSGPLGALGTHAAANYLPFTATKSVVGKIATGASKLIPKIKVPAGAATAATAAGRIHSMSKVKKP